MKKQLIRWLAVLMGVAVLAACGGGSPGGATTATPSISVSLASTTVTAGAPVKVSATVKNASGVGIQDVVVAFATEGNQGSFSASSATTNASGVAEVFLSPAVGVASGADYAVATATVSTTLLTARSGFTIPNQAPSLTVLSVSNSNVSATSPATLRVVARDLNGALLPNVVVRFESPSSLATFFPATQGTDINGEATTVISPALDATSGADLVTASITVQGLTAKAERLFQFVSATPSGTPTLDLALSTTSISAATPATVTATLRDAQGNGVAGQVVTFNVVRQLASTNVLTALTNAQGNAVVRLAPASSTSAGADEVSASVAYAGSSLQRTQGFQVQATAVTLDSLTAALNPLSAYAQTNLTLAITGASVTSPVNIQVTSACVALGKATLSPASFTATSASVTMQYQDKGCGAVQSTDQLQAVVTSSGTSRALSLAIGAPTQSSIAFISASPEQIYLRGSGLGETSTLIFEVRDNAGNPLPNQLVELRLQTGAGQVTMQGRQVESLDSTNPYTLTSDASGRVSVLVNAGTLPTPVRVNARLATAPGIATVSSNLSVAIGLPSQLNFSLSQSSRNIEGYDIDGTTNTYTIIAADRSGNPVPVGTAISFVAEGGQIEASKQTQLVGGIARTTANFVSSEPRPVDGRVTVTVYALGEESFIDLNGNNQYDAGESFQDLGNVFKDRNFDGIFDASVDEYLPLGINNASACAVTSNALLALDASIPTVGKLPGAPFSEPNTCDGLWSGAGQAYVRRAVETVLSTSAARPLWASTTGLAASCSKIILQTGNSPTDLSTANQLTRVNNDTWYGGGAAGTLSFIVADANPGRTAIGLSPRLNPMAAGTLITATTPTTGLSVTLNGGSPVPSTSAPSGLSISYEFTDTAVNSGVVNLRFTSPSGLISTFTVGVARGTLVGAGLTACPS
jgi:hypothetical protein